MKKTVGVLSLIVMLLSQVFTPFAYAVSGDELPVPEPVVEEIVPEPEVVEPVVVPEIDNSTGDNNFEVEEISTGEIVDVVESIDVEINIGTTVTTGEETKNLEEENVLTGAEASSGFIEKITESIKDSLGVNEEAEEENFESKEIYGTGEYEGVKVEVYAKTGLFLSGTELTIEPVVEESLEQVKQVLSGEVEMMKGEKQIVIAFDITFRDPETQEELQPKNGTVQVKFNYEENESLVQAEENEEQEVKVYHLNDIDEEGNKIEELTGTVVEEVVVNEEQSEEDNIMVVEAEKFSIYALIGRSNVVTVTYNANGGVFNNNEEELVVTYTNYKPNINVQAPNRGTDNTNIQSGWMFAGWYTTPTNQVTEWLGQYGDTTQSTMTVYAKWLPFNNIELNEIGLTGVYIMDRNLGAEGVADGTAFSNVTYHEDYNKLGYYYQWGNNYGFKNNGSINQKYGYNNYDKVDGDSYGPNNYFSNSTFIKQYSGYPPYRWTKNDNRNLWGGENSANSDTDKQGPCPEGYHIPDTLEWNILHKLFSKVNKQSTDYCGEFAGTRSEGKCIASKLKLPFAGYRDFSSTNVGYYDTNYWSSSYYGEDQAYAFQIFGSNSYYVYPQQKKYRAYGYPVRCFKNSDAKTITFLTEGGNQISEINVKRWDSILYSDLPNNPEKEGYEFAGWYELGSSEEYDFSQQTMKNVNLYEKWISNDQFSEGNSAKLIEGKRFNVAMKMLVKGDFAEYDEVDSLIQGIERSSIIPQGGNKKIISTTDSETPVIARYDADSQKIKYYTHAKDIYMNEDSSYMFSNLKNLKSFDLGQFKTDYVLNMEGLFASSYTSIEGLVFDFTNLNLSNVQNMSHMFDQFGYGYGGEYNINGLTINFSETDMSSVENVEKMFYFAFYNIKSLSGVKIDFSNAKMGIVKDMSKMFYELGYASSSDYTSVNGLTIDFSNAILTGVESMNQMFYYSLYYVENINGLRIDFSNAKMNNLKDMSQMFFELGYSYWSESMSGITIDFSDAEMNSVTNMSDMFNSAFEYGKNINGLTIDFTNVDFSNEDESLEINMQKMFQSFCNGDNIDVISGVTINFSGTDLKRVGSMKEMFSSALRGGKVVNGIKIDFTNTDISGVTNMSQMFSNFCYGNNSSSESVTISGAIISFREAKLSSVEDMQKMYNYAFANWKSINNVRVDFSNSNFSGNITNNVVNMKEMFSRFGEKNYYNGESLSGVTIDFSEADLSRVTNMELMFDNSFRERKSIDGLTIDFSNVEMNDVVNMKKMFNYALYYVKYASGLTIDFSNAKMSNVKDMSSMFYEFFYTNSSDPGFISGVIIDFSEADISRVTNMGNMFYYAFKYLNINGLKFDFSKVNFSAEDEDSYLNMEQMFYETCYGYGTQSISGVKIDFSESDMSRVTNMSKMFYYLFAYGRNISGIEINFSKANFGDEDDGGNLNLYQMFYEMCYGYGMETISGIKIDFSESIMSRVTNMKEMFYYALSYYKKISGIEINFRNVDFGNNSSSIDMTKMFYGLCYGYGVDFINGVTINFSEDDLSRVVSMEEMFSYSFSYIDGEKLDKIEINWNNTIFTGALINMKKMFNYCGLKDFDFSNFDTKNVINMNGIFNYCTNLTGLDLSSFDTKKVENVESMFYGAKNIKTIYVGENFILNSGINSGNMFIGTESIVGGNGTLYTGVHVNGEYAVIDDLSHSGYFTNVLDKPYKIKYNLNGGILSGEKTTYTARHEFILINPTKEGYNFVGWIGSNGNNPETTVRIYQGTKGNLSYTAQWELVLTPSAGGGHSITPAVKEQEHKVAEEKQEANKDESVKEQTKTPEKINTTTNQTSSQQSSSNNINANATTVDPEIQSAYEWAYEHNVTTIPSLDEANPDGPVTRGHLAKMVVNYVTNVLGQEIPEKIPSECRWNDGRGDWESEEIKDYAVKSCALGLMGLDMDKFLPNMQVTRAQFGTIMSRLLWGKKYAGGTPYYRKHLNALKENGIMTQIENPERRVELRQWVWVMLMRSAQNK